eukprot:COSAG04_NODE_1324_length_7219_cov_3.786376_1_plen_138_part_00
MRLEGDWRADGYLIARELFDAPRVASLLEISEHCRERWMELNPEWGGPGNPQPRGSPPPSAEQLATARSMRHLNHPDYFEGGAQSEQFATLMEAVADPDVQSLATSVIGRGDHRRASTGMPRARQGALLRANGLGSA